MATSISNVRVKFDLVRPDGKRQRQVSTVTGIAPSRRWLVDTLLHGEPVGSKIENLRQVTTIGDKEIPNQHPFFTEPIESRRAAPHKDLHEFHPGVEPPLRPEEIPTPEPDAELRGTPAGMPKLPDNPDTYEDGPRVGGQTAAVRATGDVPPPSPLGQKVIDETMAQADRT